jgi:hypothetical protein
MKAGVTPIQIEEDWKITALISRPFGSSYRKPLHKPPHPFKNSTKI